MKKQSVERKFVGYVSQNILGMIGISAYILADTFFISKAEGTAGITALNLVLPIYGLIFGIGAMLGVGSAIRFNILRARNDKSADEYFSNALLYAVIFGLVFMAAGAAVPDRIMEWMGGDAQIVAVGTPYTRIFLLFAPFFMGNHICNAFVRNDKNPNLAMRATLFSSLFNIVMDYVLMFPLGLGMAGAAWATACSPIVGILICCRHFFSEKCTIKLVWKLPSVKQLITACKLGTSAFIGEISSGVTTAIFNFLILELAGNDGVAAYGVVANTSIVAISIFNGVSQGAQPLFSQFYGRGDDRAVRKILKMALGTAIVLALTVVISAGMLAEPLVRIFNSENNVQMAAYGVEGVRIYFVGFLFAGFNIVGAGYLGATENSGWAFLTSIMRGIVAISVCAFVLARIFGMTGIWMAFPAAELLTTFCTSTAIKKG
ncbi:MATE family efflux transporter [Sporofaciens sp. SGI.106]|uniref:MATE family efflux transporter n=1 Tax=Sporofaciens sp. SGI.106 TaxID=3420568 RepID=UPI003D074686